MLPEPHFQILSRENISKEFLDRNIHTFSNAAQYIRDLKYKRNTDKEHLISVFKESCGTCSTKHAVLKQLSNENQFQGISLVIGIFRMNATNTPEVGKTLMRFDLDYIPEAHCYLKFEGEICDYTKPGFEEQNFKKDLLKEIEIRPDQVSSYKISLHKDYLRNWLKENPEIAYSFEEIWNIREQCIMDLSQ